MWDDLRYGLRTLRKAPGFAAVAIATLALGIGANTAVFSLVDAAILRPLAYRDAQRLFAIHEVVPKFANIAPLIPVNAMHFLEWRKSARSFEQLALIGGDTMNLTGTGDPERVNVARVSPRLFRILGVQPHLGRLLFDEEDAPGRDDIVVLSDQIWRRRFHADPSIPGRKILLNGRAYTVAGVLPADFHFPKLSQLYAMSIAEERPDFWKPFALRKEEMDPMGDFNFLCIAQLRPGVTASRAQEDLNAVQAAIAAKFPEKIELRSQLVGLQDQITGRSRAGLELILAAVAAVLLIACVNIANLLLARATGRRRELAIRSALGAGAARLVRQMLAESLLLAAAGGALGMVIAYGAMRAILAYAPVDLPRMDEIHPDLRLLAFNLAVSLAAGLLFGLLPAWRFSQADPQDALRSSSRGSTAGRSSGRLRSLLVALEVGLGALCLIAGGLLLHSFVKLLNVDKGFEAERVLTLNLSLPHTRYPDDDKQHAFDRSLLAAVAPLPGVVAAGIVNQLPLAGEGNNNLILPEGANLKLLDQPLVDVRKVNPDYFRAIGIPLRAGRLFEERDGEHFVALVSAHTAARVWPGVDVLGRRFYLGDGHGPLFEIVGVVGDIRGVSLNRAPSDTIYLPYWQRSDSQISLVVRMAAARTGVGPEIRAALRRLDPEMPVPALRTMDELVSDSLAQRRFQMVLVLLFAAAALLLASLGIYGVVSYSVGQRTGEMGIRLALGAAPGRIRALVLRQAMMPAAAGLAAGVAVSLPLGRLLGAMLFGVSGSDPLTVGAVAAVLTAVAAAASYIPARRATRIDPAVALRVE